MPVQICIGGKTALPPPFPEFLFSFFCDYKVGGGIGDTSIISRRGIGDKVGGLKFSPYQIGCWILIRRTKYELIIKLIAHKYIN
jgi:hypothetical protein